MGYQELESGRKTSPAADQLLERLNCGLGLKTKNKNKQNPRGPNLQKFNTLLSYLEELHQFLLNLEEESKKHRGGVCFWQGKGKSVSSKWALWREVGGMDTFFFFFCNSLTEAGAGASLL